MSEGNPTGEKLEEYVEALQDYQYEHHGQTFIISKGEIFLVLKSTNNIWWQVIRAGSKRAFYAPAQHLQHKSLSEEEMKKIISGHNSSSENVTFQRRSHELDGGGACSSQELSPNSTHAASQALRSYPGHLKTSPLHISKSSLNEGSAESFRHQPIKPFIKSRSIDELRSGGRSHSTLDITKIRETSSEELDRRSSGSIQLSPRLRSSSFDLRMPPKDTEMKQGSLDKPRNSRISKDQGDRRRSWALENFRPSLKRGETVDAAIVLDVPPELPPKTRPKRGLSTFSSNPENVGHLEGPIDIKVEQARMAKAGQSSLGKEQHAGMEIERRHSRHSSDPLLLLEEKTSYQESQNGKGPPIALPRKLLPPQTSFMESRPEVQPYVGDYTHRDANGNKVKETSSQSSIASMSYTTHEGSGKTREFLGSFRQKSKAGEPPQGKSSGTPEMIIKNDTNPAPPQKCRPESPKTLTVKSKFSPGFGSFRNKSKRETKKEEKEKEPLTRETPTPDSSRGGKIVQTPPSPRCPPQRTLNGDWGEYIEEVSKRPYYYNSVTREKRWKPPRCSKGTTSNSISEVLSTGTEDRNCRGNAPQCPPKCPTPDYPNSPRFSHKPFSYTCNPDTTPIHSTHPRVVAHNSSSTTTPHSTTSQTLTNSTTSAIRSMSPPQISGKLMPLSFATPPAVPPSSAKPTFPTTPTTPEFADFTAATTTDDQNYALLDILYKMKLPRGWEKKYDAFNQRIYFHNVVTRERPRGVSCVSELDIAHLNDRQYTRKSYQSNMDLSKELQLDANVLEDDRSVPADEVTSSEQKIPPPKPPRTLSLAPDAVVIMPNRLQQMEGQSRVFTSPTDQASIVVAGSQVSSFNPMSSFSKPRGHSRSKSESSRNTYAASSNLGTQELIPVVGGRALDVQRETSQSSSPSLDLTRSKSPSLRSKSPSCKTSLSPQICKFPVPSSRTSHIKEDIREITCTLPRLIIGEKGITGNALGNPKEKSTHTPLSSSENVTGDSKQASTAEIEGVSEASRKQYSSILQELSTHSLKPSKSLLPSPNVEEEQGSAGVHVKEQYSDKSSETEAFLLDTPFTLSKMSRLNQSRKAKQTSGLRFRRYSGDNLLEPRNQIRNSSFITHDEDGSILENKPLSKLTQMAASEGVSIFQKGWPMELVVPPSLLLGSSELNDSPRNDDSEESSPTCNFSFDGQEYRSFQDPDKWLATSSDEGKVYYYEESGTKSAWRLPEVDETELPDQEGCLSQPLSSPAENYRLSNITENLSELSDRILREGFLHRTFLMRDSKKVRKNWTHSYTRYIVHSFSNGCSGILYFTKNKDDEKRYEIFEFFSPCYLEHASDKKTSRQLVLGLRNGHDTEVLLQFEEKEIAEEWLKVLTSHEGIEYSANTEKEDKKGKKGAEKIKRETSVEQLNPDSKGIKDKLRNFIRRRPMRETLENKGIYKESVFGSTLAELKSQDKTNIPIFVLLCIQNIEKNEENLKTDGLYRISGNAAQIQKIRFEVAQRKYNVLSQEKEIHNLSGALKLFFRELKEPLIPYENYDDFIRATGSEYRRMNQQADKLMKAVNKLPAENRDTLRVLVQHLLRVSEYESENRMSLSNLAIVFGPCLMWPKVTLSHDLMTDVMLHNRVVEGLLCDFNKIFSRR
ncbi:uncharacterized protein LOC135104997 isoform X3 [Scylla paramamosain]